MTILRWVWIIQLYILCYGQIIELNDINVSSVIAQSKFSMIYFTKPKCRLCEVFDDIYMNLSEVYDNNKEFQILKINSEANPSLREKFKPSTYPSIYLYNDQDKILLKYEGSRDLLSLVNFINDNSDTINKELKSKVHLIKTMQDFNSRKHKGNVIVISLSSLPEWEEYEFPSHFYQKLAYQHDLRFHILYLDSMDETDFVNEFRISNYPSVIYFESPTRFKIYKTLSKDHLSNTKLDQLSLIRFIDNLNTDTVGYWFNSTQDLETFITNQKYEHVHQNKVGFNVNQNHIIIDDDLAYKEMVDNIDL